MKRALRILAAAVLALTWAGAADQTNRPLTTLQRLERAHLEAAHAARLRFAAQRQSVPSHGLYEDFRAIIHVHADDADHTKGTRSEALAAAKKAGAQIVMTTDHRGPKPDAWRGMREGVLFIPGAETAEGPLWFPDYDAQGQPMPGSGRRFLAHPEERLDAPTEGFLGMEICNRHTDAILDKGPFLYLAVAMTDPARWQKVVVDFKAFPDEFFAAGVAHHAEIFAKWDAETRRKPFTGIAASDAHQNNILKDVVFDPYEVSFRNLSTHVLARELTEPAVWEALQAGHVYVAYDWLCDPTGFAFGAVNTLGVFPMGDSAPLLGTKATALTPLAAKLRLIHHGKVIRETVGTNLTCEVGETGAYRLEAWLNVDGEDRPWIYSNPVYIRQASPADLSLPPLGNCPEVEARKDIPYAEGPEADAPKHKLDLYIPKGKTPAPVFFFIHGGAWRYGDRSQYPPLGNRYAKAGLLTVVPSYRLAPAHPHPAQIEDVAAAFAWTVRHVAEAGGDTNRIYVGGHSAGGHLTALLTLDERYLRPYGLSPKLIRGALALSGVYNLDIGEAMASVFGKDPQARREASPLFHVRTGAPPFLVTYCQWDYFSLPAQARQFHAALRQAGIPAELVYVPGLNHISEMTNVAKDDDPTVAAALRFMGR